MTKRGEGRDYLARSFGGVASSYEQARPGYPIEAVEWLLESALRRVLDLGAGTGKLTRQLVENGFEVIAVEPSVQMLEQLRSAVTGAEALPGTAESIPLAADDVDAVVVAQAFHWFDAPVALAEIARVLRSGGTLGLVWNIPDSDVGWVSRLSALTGGLPSKPPDPSPLIGAAGWFSEVETQTFAHKQVLTRNELLRLVGSWSYFAQIAAVDRQEKLAAVGHLYDDVATRGRVDLAYVTYAYRTRRL